MDIKHRCHRNADGFSSLFTQTREMAAISGEQAMTLLDFTQKPNIALLDEVVNCFYGTVGPQVSFERFKEVQLSRVSATCSNKWRNEC